MTTTNQTALAYEIFPQVYSESA